MRQRLVQRERRSDLNLDLLGRALADQQVVFALQIIGDGLVHLVAGHAHRARIDNARKRNHGDIRRSAADIDHHVARGLGNRQSGADRRHHRLLHQIDFAGLGAISRVFNGALFYLRNLRRHADHDPRVHQHLAVVRLLNEVVEHLLRDFEVGDHAVLHRLDGHDVAGRAAQHLLGFFAHGLHFAGVLVDGDNGGLIDDDALARRVNKSVGGA